MIEIKRLIKKRNNFSIKIQKILIESNNLCVLLGENGAGKTTFLKTLLGLEIPDVSQVLWDGNNILENTSMRKQIGYVPDSPVLYKYLTGREFLNFINRLYGYDGENLVDYYAKKFNLYDFLDEYIYDYSKGTKQKVSIIAALIHKPKYLILDEPFTALDPSSIIMLKQILDDFIKSGGTVIFSTHDLDVAEKIYTSVLIIDNGRIVYNGKKDTINLEALYKRYVLKVEK